MKKKNKLKSMLSILGLTVLVAVITIGFVGCPDNDPKGTDGNPAVATSRYETVPFIGMAAATDDGGYNGEDIDPMLDKLVYAGQGPDYNYYVFLLGSVKSTPLAFRMAAEYNGVTPITIEYSQGNVTEQSISESLEKAQSNTTSSSYSYNHTLDDGTVAKLLLPLTYSISRTWSSGYEETHSTAETYTTARSESSSQTDTISMIIGMNNEPAGKYRWALFCATDVWLMVITDHDRTKIEDSYTYIGARPDTFAWGIDFDPSLAGTFAKTAPGSLLEYPEIDLEKLPSTGLIVIDEKDIPQRPRAEKPTATGDTTFFNQVSVTLSTTTAGATIHYTTNNTDPTTSSPVYTGPITITQTTNLRAIAVAGHFENSPLFNEYYTKIDPKKRIAAGPNHSLFIDGTGQLWAAGINNSGQIGDGTTTNRPTPVRIMQETKFIAVAAGGAGNFGTSFAIDSNGKLYAWGNNGNYQLGDGSTTTRHTPVAIRHDLSFTAVATGDRHGLALDVDGNLWSWGTNANGRVGDGTTTTRSTPVQITQVVMSSGSTQAAPKFRSISVGNNGGNSFATDGYNLYGWGFNEDGRVGLGNNNKNPTIRPTQLRILGLPVVAAGETHCLALGQSGYLYAWGRNDYTKLGWTNAQIGGDFLFEPSNVPGTYRLIAAGQDDSIAVGTDNKLYGWGRNHNGQLGVGDTSQKMTPTPSTTTVNFIAISIGIDHAIGMDVDGKFWGWGWGAESGTGANNAQNMPTPISTITQ